ncbi:MAG: Ser/Thr-protein kinase [Candidatus Paraimprobicoccus trichonymphae]|uniref:non-specific serine/threonine protein kinase n=1 Tax=Candidatus Paraimprobicoccus trichonymphae TaxID=3033793 RepID=A0AA48HWX9_9FIRM|nr:MAG: Ser/Thr-protein kinase [Candidatus Paraimprobicoccus trichonymphae]
MIHKKRNLFSPFVGATILFFVLNPINVNAFKGENDIRQAINNKAFTKTSSQQSVFSMSLFKLLKKAQNFISSNSLSIDPMDNIANLDPKDFEKKLKDIHLKLSNLVIATIKGLSKLEVINKSKKIESKKQINDILKQIGFDDKTKNSISNDAFMEAITEAEISNAVPFAFGQQGNPQFYAPQSQFPAQPNFVAGQQGNPQFYAPQSQFPAQPNFVAGQQGNPQFYAPQSQFPAQPNFVAGQQGNPQFYAPQSQFPAQPNFVAGQQGNPQFCAPQSQFPAQPNFVDGFPAVSCPTPSFPEFSKITSYPFITFRQFIPNSMPQSQFPGQQNPMQQQVLPQSRSNLENYEFGKLLGEGSFGRVYEAIDKLNGQKVCIKMILFHNNDKELKELQNEAHVWCNLEHKNVVKYYCSFVKNEYLYIVMELVEGKTLNQLLDDSSMPLNENWALYYFNQLLDAVMYCHINEIIHRDLKPQNILLGNDNQIKLADFGVSKDMNMGGALAKTQIGTPFYMAPEIFRKLEYSYEVDVWALGCLLYEMVTKEKPFGTDYLTFMGNVVNNDPEPINTTNCSDDLKHLINMMLDKNPKTRIKTRDILKLPIIKNSRDVAGFKNYYYKEMH